MDMVFAVHAGSRGLDFYRRHMSERLFRSNRPGYPHLWATTWKKRLSEWRFVTTVSPTFSGGVRLIEPANLYMCAQTQDRPRHKVWFRTAESPGKSRYENQNISPNLENAV